MLNTNTHICACFSAIILIRCRPGFRSQASVMWWLHQVASGGCPSSQRRRHENRHLHRHHRPDALCPGRFQEICIGGQGKTVVALVLMLERANKPVPLIKFNHSLRKCFHYNHCRSISPRFSITT